MVSGAPPGRLSVAPHTGMTTAEPRASAATDHIRTVPCPWIKHILDVTLSGVGLVLSAPP